MGMVACHMIQSAEALFGLHGPIHKRLNVSVENGDAHQYPFIIASTLPSRAIYIAQCALSSVLLKGGFY